MEGWANASVVIGSGEGAELHRIRSVDPSGTVLRIGRPTERAHTAQVRARVRVRVGVGVGVRVSSHLPEPWDLARVTVS